MSKIATVNAPSRMMAHRAMTDLLAREHRPYYIVDVVPSVDQTRLDERTMVIVRPQGGENVRYDVIIERMNAS